MGLGSLILGGERQERASAQASSGPPVSGSESVTSRMLRAFPRGTRGKAAEIWVLIGIEW